MYQANHTWIQSIRRQLRRALTDGFAEEYNRTKQQSFLSFPIPECSCMKEDSGEKSARASSPSASSKFPSFVGVMRSCPGWMDGDTVSQLKDKEVEEELEEDDSPSSELFFEQQNSSDNSQEGNNGGGGGEINNKEDTQMEDNEELEGGER